MEWAKDEMNNAPTVFISISFVGIQFVVKLKLLRENLTLKRQNKCH
jgi:hypothetical protein